MKKGKENRKQKKQETIHTICNINNNEELKGFKCNSYIYLGCMNKKKKKKDPSNSFCKVHLRIWRIYDCVALEKKITNHKTKNAEENKKE